VKRGDARKLNRREQALLRKKAVLLVQSGKPQTEIARELAVSRSAVAKWMRAYRSGGAQALSSQPRGRPCGTGLLTDTEKRRLIDAVCSYTPTEVRLGTELWTNQAIRELLLRDFCLSVTMATISLWMRQWGLVGPQPRTDANASYDEETSQLALWYLRDLPQVKRLARKCRVRVFLFDEKPLPTQPDHVGPAQTMLCAVDGPGTLYFRVVTPPVTAGTRMDFLRGLQKDVGRSVIVLLDTHRGNPRECTCEGRPGNADDIMLVRIPVDDLQRIPIECWPFKKVRRVGTMAEWMRKRTGE